jgi:hypothetical protein
MLNATRGDALHSDDKHDIMRLETIGGIIPSLVDEPRAVAGKLAATVIAELTICLLLNVPTFCLRLLSSITSVEEPFRKLKICRYDLDRSGTREIKNNEGGIPIKDEGGKGKPGGLVTLLVSFSNKANTDC